MYSHDYSLDLYVLLVAACGGVRHSTLQFAIWRLSHFLYSTNMNGYLTTWLVTHKMCNNYYACHSSFRYFICKKWYFVIEFGWVDQMMHKTGSPLKKMKIKLQVCLVPRLYVKFYQRQHLKALNLYNRMHLCKIYFSF
jgi:hypothetical protein